MIGTYEIKVSAARPNFPLQPMFAFMGSPSSLRILEVPKKIGNWNITSVRVVAQYPDNTTIEKVAVRTGSVWVATIDGCEIAGKVGNGLSILADGIDEDGNEVYGYVLGKGDVYVIENSIDISRLLDKITVRYIEDIPDVPTKGDLMNSNGELRLFDGNDWILISTGEHSVVYDSQITIQKNGTSVGSFTVNASEPKTINIPVPSKTSELDNDSGFITSADVPTKTSDLTNDSGFITSAEIEPYHNSLTPTENTGLAKTAYTLALNDYTSFKPVEDGQFYATLRTHRDLTNQFRATMRLATYYPYVMSMYNGQTLSPELSLYFCKDQLRYGSPRPRQYYDGYMFRTAGAGFAIPCSEDGTPDGRLIETTDVQGYYVLMANNTTSIHSIGFSADYNDIVMIDGQSDMIFAHRTNAYKIYSFSEEIANKSELPTKTSDLTNDSGFITATALTPYREKSDLYYEHSFHKANWQNVPRFIMNYDGTQIIFDKFDSTLDRWTVSTGTSDWYVQTDFVGMEADPQFMLMKLESGIANILPTEGAGTTTVTFSDMGIQGTFTMDMSDQLVCKVYVDKQLSALEARIAALENNNQ